MCNAYHVGPDIDFFSLLEALGADWAGEPWNDEPAGADIRPTDLAPVVRAVDGRRTASRLRWGLVPPWAGDPRDFTRRYLTTNARVESAAESRTYSDPLRHRRCLVPAAWIIEWSTPPDWKKGRKKPRFHIRRRDGGPLVMAGLWDRWRGAGAVLESFSVLTGRAAADTLSLHERSPVFLLDADAWRRWLDPANDPQAMADLLAPAPPGTLVALPAG